MAEKYPMRLVLLVGMFTTIALGILFWYWTKMRIGRAQRSSTGSPTYVGQERCSHCHAAETEAWRTSHHAVAMQLANDTTVLGNFKNTQLTKDGVTSIFFSKDGKFYVRTNGQNSKLQDFDFEYTFGVFPLQQYLVPFPNGRLQSFVLAWDSRLKERGGQRWFHLYPDQTITSGDPLHWTGRNQTWNYMCADCHSTNLRRNYNLARDSYTTTWSEINVSCESCHGPGSSHVAWAESHKKGAYQPSDGPNGLLVHLKDVPGSWSVSDPDAGTMHWTGEPRSGNEIATCAPCHSRRHPIQSGYHPGQPFLDGYVPSLLEDGVYYADGQILEEDYEWGSFVQSKMYHEGVTCSDCHNPHSGKLPKVSINSVCGKCHMLSKFGAAAHTHHKPESSGALCVNCHMPTRTYMVVDVRRDHSFRVPRPDISLTYGTPNACTQCHKEKSASWAAEMVVKRYGADRRRETQFVEAIDAGRRGLRNAEKALTGLIADSTKPAIARATALSLLPQYLTPGSVSTLQAVLVDSDPLVRMEAVRSLEPLSQPDRVRLAAPLLTDPIRSVRIEAARLLAGTAPELLNGGQKTNLDRGVTELIESEMASSERPENHMNLALLYAQMGRTSDAETELKTALRLDPAFVPAMVNLADLYRTQQRDDEGQRWLENALAVAPNAAEPMHALGLLKIRQKRYPEAIGLLARAATLQPDNVRYSYVYAVALQSTGQIDQAITILEQAHRRRPADRQTLIGLIAFERDKGNVALAITYVQDLIQLVPEDPNAKMMLADLLRRRR